MPANDDVALTSPGVAEGTITGSVVDSAAITTDTSPGSTADTTANGASTAATGAGTTATTVSTTATTPGIAVEHSARACDGALVRAFSFLGKRWNGVILATLFGGAMGFAELRRSVGAISDSVLSDRLSELAGAGLVERSVQVGPPVSVEYQLTPAGQALLPAMNALTTWSRTNLPA